MSKGGVQYLYPTCYTSWDIAPHFLGQEEEEEEEEGGSLS